LLETLVRVPRGLLHIVSFCGVSARNESLAWVLAHVYKYTMAPLIFPTTQSSITLYLQGELSNTFTMTTTNPSSVNTPAESKEAASFEIEDPSQTSIISDDRDQYLMMRHGTLELDPLPSSSSRDPLNWPTWKKDVHVLMVAFHAMMTTFTAASIIPGFHSFALKYGTSIEQASYLTSAQVS
jgi:hypothetical protein